MSTDLMGALLLANEEAKRARGTVQARDMEIATLTARIGVLEAALRDLWEWQRGVQELPSDALADRVCAALSASPEVKPTVEGSRPWITCRECGNTGWHDAGCPLFGTGLPYPAASPEVKPTLAERLKSPTLRAEIAKARERLDSEDAGACPACGEPMRRGKCPALAALEHNEKESK